jgi:hypothetical protein
MEFCTKLTTKICEERQKAEMFVKLPNPRRGKRQQKFIQILLAIPSKIFTVFFISLWFNKHTGKQT